MELYYICISSGFVPSFRVLETMRAIRFLKLLSKALQVPENPLKIKKKKEFDAVL